jgi:hypothetical protein
MMLITSLVRGKFAGVDLTGVMDAWLKQRENP